MAIVARWASLAVLAGVAAASGCSVVPSDHRVWVDMTGAPARADRPIAVDIENRNGSVTLVVDPSLKKPYIEAAVTQPGKITFAVPPNAKVRSWYTADLRVRGGKPILRVASIRDAATQDATQIHLKVFTPSADGVRIRNSGGMVEIRNATGDFVVENGSTTGVGGDIHILASQRMAGNCDIATTKGDILLDITGNSAGRFELTSVKGSAEFASRGASVLDVHQTASTWTGTLNQGANLIKLRTAEGRAQVNVGIDSATFATAPDPSN